MAYYERKHADIVEVPLEISSDQQGQLDELRAEISKDASLSDITDGALFKFLRGNSFNVQNAAKAFREYVQWRAESNIDKILDTKIPKIDLINKLIPYAYIGYDNDGRPIYIEKTGKIITSALADSKLLTTDEFIESHKYGIELLMKRAFESSIKLKKRIDTFTTIIDLTGLGMGHRQAIPILAACMQFDAKYYPEKIGKLYVVNAPWVAPYLYQAVQYLLDPITKSRVHIVNGDPKLFLPTVIPQEHLPVEYGGTCTQSVPVYDASDIAKETVIDDGLSSEYVTYEFQKELDASADGSTFTWFFKSEGDYDIDFSIEIQTPGMAKDKKVFLKPVSRIVTCKGSYTSTGPCKLIFRWDNSFSWMNNKTIKYLLNVAHLDMKMADTQSSANSEQIKAAGDAGKAEAK